MADFLSSRKETIWIDYHNITPSAFFDGWDNRTSASQHIGRIQLERLSEIAQLALADSHFNESELIELGFSSTRVLPILFNPDNFEDAAIDPTILYEGKQRWLFVGRITPGKAQHNLIRSFAAYKKLYNPNCELYLVGKPATPRYFDSLTEMVDDLGLNDAVFLTKGVSSEELSIYYQTADIFVSLSEHEGFCVPLLEAMHYQLPILALASSAVPETLADAGVLIESSDPLRVATAVDLVLRDQRLLEDLRHRAKDRLAKLSLENARIDLRNLLNSYGLADGVRP
jgi:glycosyltransferase involved in cell wall biosynthesis